MVERYTLSNGIPLFIAENHACPVVSIQVWVRRGSAHETDDLAGISHFIEHALFKGTEKRPVGQIALEIESFGGEINAYTSYEETVYYTTLASRFFINGLDVLADAVKNPLFDPKEMEREKEVILEEIKRAQDSPGKVLFNNLWKNSFPKTPYGRPIIGFRETVKKMSAKTLAQYYKKRYHAGSIGVVVVGDINKEKVNQQVRKRFASIKKGPFWVPKNREGTLSPRRTSPGVVTAARDINECHIQIGIMARPITHPDIPPIDLACSAIGQGESSRIYQTLVKEKRLAQDVSVNLVATRGAGLVTISLITSPEQMEKAVQESRSVFERAAQRGLDDEEIERVKSSLESETTYGKETVEGYARRLGFYHCHFGDPEYEKKYLNDVLAIDSEQVQNALRSMVAVRPCLSVIHPQDFIADKKALKSALFRPIPKAVPAQKDSKVPELTQRGPVRIITKNVGTLPTVAVRFIFSGGSREEPNEKLGLGNLFQHLWTAGTKSYTSLQIAHELESIGANLDAFCGRNTCGLSMEFLSKHWKRVKPIVKEIIEVPTFPEDEFLIHKNIVLREILTEKDMPGQLCHLNFLNALYPDHPYGRSQLGTEESVSSISTADLKQFYRDYAHQKHLVVSTVGHFQKDIWLEELEELTHSFPEEGNTVIPPLSVSPPSEPKILTAQKTPLFQSHILVGFLGASFQDPDRHALKVLASCLSGQGGRLFMELRDRKSLAYSVAPISFDAPEPGMFAFYIACSPEKVEESIRGIRDEIIKVITKPISAKELDRAKRYWIGRYEIDMQRYNSQALLYGLNEIYGLSYRHFLELPQIIRSITAKNIREAAEKRFLLDRPIISIVHPKPLEKEHIQSLWS